MLRVLLVDDEPFILQGIKMLIDWEQEGFEIAGMAANGKEAIAFLGTRRSRFNYCRYSNARDDRT